jgi:large subunit ribosomal protein L19e
MAKLTLQRKIAAKILKVGENKVWFDPSKTEEIKKAVTRADVKRLVEKKIIKALSEKLKKPKERKKRKRGPGSKKGGKYSRLGKKRRWIITIRPLRKMLKELRDSGRIDRKTYRKLYLMAKGGMFRSRAHLKTYLEQHGLIKGENKN